MPGTIQISVVDITDLPPSSEPPSSTSIRVIMGRREYQAPDNGDLSIPLTTLRENLIVKLLNSDGQEISNTGVETRSVVEKGVWDEILNIKGGGKLHLKVQFVLSEEEQSRIRMMRLSALKKKHGELVKDSPMSPAKPPAEVGRDPAILSPNSRGISGSVSGKEEGPTRPVLASQSPDFEVASKSEVIKANNPSPILKTPNHTNKVRDTSAVTQEKAESPSTESDSNSVIDKIERRSPPEATSRKSAFPVEKATSAKPSSLSHSRVEKVDAAEKTEMRGPREKTPSNVRKMISAFETSLTQDKRPRIKPPPTKPKPSKIETEPIERADERVGPTGDVIEVQPVEFSTKIDEKSSISMKQQSVESRKSGQTEEKESAGISGRSQSSSKDEEYSKGRREWMFLHERNDFCATTGGKKVLQEIEDREIETNTQEKQVQNSRGWEKASACWQRKPERGGSVDAEPSGGPFGQIVKIAIMVGFGALVLFTRQRKDRPD